jgi:hypothetical protein
MINLPLRSLGRIAWSKSVIVPNPKADAVTSSQYLPTKKLFDLKTSIPSSARARPKLDHPELRTNSSFRLPRYFSKGKEAKVQPPAWNLITESLETAVPLQIPYNRNLIKTLCKGSGVLKKNEQGLVFLDIENSFINSLAPFFEAAGMVRPPYFNIFGQLQGAHIPIIPKREADFNFLTLYREMGTTFSFEVEGLYSLAPDCWPEMKEIWFLKVRSIELENFRRNYFLPPLPGGHSFTIVVAIKPHQAGKERPVPIPFMRVNPSCMPV